MPEKIVWCRGEEREEEGRREREGGRMGMGKWTDGFVDGRRAAVDDDHRNCKVTLL